MRFHTHPHGSQPTGRSGQPRSGERQTAGDSIVLRGQVRQLGKLLIGIEAKPGGGSIIKCAQISRQEEYPDSADEHLRGRRSLRAYGPHSTVGMAAGAHEFDLFADTLAVSAAVLRPILCRTTTSGVSTFFCCRCSSHGSASSAKAEFMMVAMQLPVNGIAWRPFSPKKDFGRGNLYFRILDQK